ncbi:transmembrane anchor protein [Hydrogenophaga sp.]|uniref:transmembrane anchor protein n=1 Tax=Hydrogenophaga sp. TaxID=1904254 RepID=UPI003AF5D892
MYNAETPSRAELPSSSKLLRSTLLAAISAIAILVAIVLPAEYGVDPTGVGRVLRMTEMGEIKQQLAADAAADASAAPAGSPASTVAAVPANAGAAVSATPSAPDVIPKTAVTPAAQSNWRDELTFTLTPGEGKEIKLRMAEGEKAEFQWIVNGGSVNYDTHGDGGGRSISYEKGRSVPADDGALVAAFTGNHGWYWRNRGSSDVKVVLRTRGQYTDIKQVQ